ncbi:MAG TPA: hypothetical protein VM287_05770, partial [Egibacteraceae bacterium]|nr:hypothetical protein [Egibacteraceae bacterium]
AEPGRHSGGRSATRPAVSPPPAAGRRHIEHGMTVDIPPRRCGHTGAAFTDRVVVASRFAGTVQHWAELLEVDAVQLAHAAPPVRTAL